MESAPASTRFDRAVLIQTAHVVTVDLMRRSMQGKAKP